MLSETDVISAYVHVLGREPESADVIRQHMGIGTREHLRVALLQSEEIRQTMKYIAFDSPKWVLAEVFQGRRSMWLDLSDRYVSFGCLSDNYEPAETEAIRSYVKPGFRVCDIRANIGWHTLALADAAGPTGKVFAFEPRNPTYSYLQKTIIENDLECVVSAFQVGIWNKPESGKLTWATGTENPGGSHVAIGRTSGEEQSITLVPLDSIVDGKIDFIKIDIEGAEYHALAGSRCLKEQTPIVVSEIYDAQLRAVSCVSADQYMSLFFEAGYTCLSLNEEQKGQQITSSMQFSREVNNALFLPKGCGRN